LEKEKGGFLNNGWVSGRQKGRPKIDSPIKVNSHWRGKVHFHKKGGSVEKDQALVNKHNTTSQDSLDFQTASIQMTTDRNHQGHYKSISASSSKHIPPGNGDQTKAKSWPALSRGINVL
jgi:hypothetical protein